MQVVLIMFRNGGERRSFTVSRSTTTIGRREDCDLRIPVGDVSRKHCRLVLSADNVRVQDLGSSNGTYVNGQKVSDQFLNAGDTVGVGPVHFVVQIDGVPAEDQLAPPAPAAAGSSLGGTPFAAGAALAAAVDAEGAGPIDAPPEPPAAPIGGEAPDELLAGDLPPEDISTEDAAYAAGAPTADPTAATGNDLTIDELPPTDAAQDAAFDLTTDADPEAAGGKAAGEWDFLADDAPAHGSQADVDINLGSAHDQPHH